MQFSPAEQQRILSQVGLKPETLELIEDQYNGPGRFYHNWFHALSVLSWVNHVIDVFPESTLAPYQPSDLRLAALLHDVYYSPTLGSPYNETASVKFLREHIGTNYPQVEELIMATADHGKRDKTQHPAVAFFLDCDLAFFLADPRWEVFLEYNRQIEMEFEIPFSPEKVKAGRRKFLEGMLAHESIFLSMYFRTQYEEGARHNLKRLLGETP